MARLHLDLAQALGVDVKTVALWRGRFAQAGAQGLWEIAPGRGRKATHSPDKINAIVQATLSTKPKGMPHWSCREMAQAEGHLGYREEERAIPSLMWSRSGIQRQA